jgi:UDP-3-O-[3-hydroxymyristoyl] glucosamine N-acyltransferase
MAAASTVAELAVAVERLSGGRLAARILGDSSLPISSTAPLDSAGPADLSFLANPRYRSQVAASAAGAIVLSGAEQAANFPGGARPAGALVACDNPYAWFAFAAQHLAREAPPAPGVHDRAVVASGARLGAGVCIEALAVVGEGAEVGEGTRIGPACVLGEGVRIGAGSRLHAGVRVYPGCTIGARAIVHAGAVIGADGFGFAPLEGAWVKIPQTGGVRLGDDVEVGANTTIDRGAAGDTVIEDGVKIDNQVQIAHNCHIGAHTAIAGCAGIAGSAVIGAGCQIGGAAMIHGHIEIAAGTVVSAGTLISRSIREPGFYTGVFPSMPNREWERNAALVRHLTEMRTRLRRLERAVLGDPEPNASQEQTP